MHLAKSLKILDFLRFRKMRINAGKALSSKISRKKPPETGRLFYPICSMYLSILAALSSFIFSET